MPNAGASAPGRENSAAARTEAIHERSRELVRRLLREGYIDAEAVKNIVQTVTGGTASQSAPRPDKTLPDYASRIRRQSTALAASAESARRALERVAERGGEATDNDIKGALASLAQLQADCTSASSALAELGRDDLRREVGQLAAHAQNVGAEASARLAAMMNEFASGVGGLYRETAAPGLQTMRDLSARMALLTSGVFAGIADALGEQRRPERPE
jgi:hypothetical protein